MTFSLDLSNVIPPYLHIPTISGALCGIAVNEIEAFLAENVTEEEIEKFLISNVCSFVSGEIQVMCDQLVQALPALVIILIFFLNLFSDRCHQ